MRIVFLRSANQGVRWFRTYYSDRPELNGKAAFGALRRARETIREYPFAGQKFEGTTDVYEKKVAKTAFSILYTVRNDTIYIADIRDQRGYRSATAIDAALAELERIVREAET